MTTTEREALLKQINSGDGDVDPYALLDECAKLIYVDTAYRAESALEIEGMKQTLSQQAELLKEASIQITNFGCDGSHFKNGCDACVFQHQLAVAEKESAK